MKRTQRSEEGGLLKRIRRCMRIEAIGVPSGKKGASTLLNSEIVEYGILPRLPAKALLRFGCVSKRWFSLISGADPYFLHLHSRLVSSSSGFLYMQGLHEAAQALLISANPRSVNIPSSFAFPIPTQLHTALRTQNLHKLDRNLTYSIITLNIERRIVASCNGLLCVCIWHPHFDIFIGNPVLKDWKLIDQFPDFISKGIRSFFGLAVDVGRSIVSYYLVVLTHDQENENFRFAFYSSRSGKWKASEGRIMLPPGSHLLVENRVAAYVKESLYWDMGNGNAVWFNPREDRSGLQRLPLSSRRYANRDYLGMVGEWNEKLSYTTVTAKLIHMWAMGKDGHWFKRHCIKLLNMVGGEIVVRKHKFCVMPYDGRGAVIYFLDGDVYCYDMTSREVTRFYFETATTGGEVSKRLDADFWHSWFPYKNTLVPLPREPQKSM